MQLLNKIEEPQTENVARMTEGEKKLFSFYVNLNKQIKNLIIR